MLCFPAPFLVIFSYLSLPLFLFSIDSPFRLSPLLSPLMCSFRVPFFFSLSRVLFLSLFFIFPLYYIFSSFSLPSFSFLFSSFAFSPSLSPFLRFFLRFFVFFPIFLKNFF
nr:MAG TPA: hypothetical protein [Caudoviricetes sp.]